MKTFKIIIFYILSIPMLMLFFIYVILLYILSSMPIFWGVLTKWTTFKQEYKEMEEIFLPKIDN